MPSRCRSNSLSSSSSSESDSDTAPSSSSSSISSSDSASTTASTSSLAQPVYQYHCPPCGMDNYDNNDTVFGSILRGDLPAVTLAESTRLLALEDIKPRAPLHALVIPKAFVGSIFDIDSSDRNVMEEMHNMALELVKSQHPEAYANNDYRLCFHIPPFNSVDHLHLHVLAPVSRMNFYYRYIKYNPHTRWCIGLEAVLERLQRGESSVPYRRPASLRPQKETAGLNNNDDCVMVVHGKEEVDAAEKIQNDPNNSETMSSS